MIKRLIRSLYAPAPDSRKGENGKLMIVAGSTHYHGAAVLAVLAARRFADLVYFCPGEKDPYLLQAVKQIPEVIVENGLSRLPEVDAVLFGSGIGDTGLPVSEIVAKSKKLVVDADGLRHIKGKIPAGAILTPHEGEFRRLFGKPGTRTNVETAARTHRCILLKKDPAGDIITDGKRMVINRVHNAGMTKGGTGDVLAGLTAALACKNDAFTAAACAAYINGYAGNLLQKRVGYSFCASDLADALAEAHSRVRKASLS